MKLRFGEGGGIKCIKVKETLRDFVPESFYYLFSQLSRKDFISLMRQDFVFYFEECKALVKA